MNKWIEVVAKMGEGNIVVDDDEEEGRDEGRGGNSKVGKCLHDV